MGTRFLQPILDRPGSAVVPPFDFDSALATFTPSMAKRTAPGPFAAAPIVQGDANNADTLTDDVLSYSRGTQISGNFYPMADTVQGSISLWWTPEYSYDALSGAGDHYIWYISSSYYLAYEYDNDRYNLTVGGQSFTVSSNIAAGTTYNIVARWDCNNDLDGTNYACLSINDSHTFGATTQPTASAPGATIYIGTNGTTGAASGIIEGGHKWRRPLYDGTYGIDVGNGDEIAAIYNAGSGADPAQVVGGSWDCTFALPTNSTAGALTTGTGEAWSHPHSSAVLTDTFCQTTYGSSAWSTKGTPSTAPDDLAAADKIFNWGYDWTCDADAEGIEQSLTSLTAGQNYVIRCIAHVSDANDLRVRVTDDTNTADIVTFEFGASSSRTAPGVGIFTFELPTIARNGAASDCTAITIAVEGTAASQQVYLHQCEVLVNLIDNPSMETGSGDPWIPDGWSNASMDTGDTEQELTIVHSGSSSLQFNPTATASDAFFHNLSASVGDFFCHGGLFYSGGGSVTPKFGERAGYDLARQSELSGSNVYVSGTLASWEHKAMVTRAIDTSPNMEIIGSDNTGYLDDIYMVALDPVSLTVTPASEANSTESTGIRVDGRDTLTQPITDITATSGTIRFSWTPRHGDGGFVSFGNSTPNIARFYNDGNNYILLLQTTGTNIRIQCVSGGVGASDDWNATGAIVAGTTYQVEIIYDATDCKLYVDDVLKATASPVGGMDFGANVPDTAYFGSHSNGTSQTDATYAAPV